MDTEYRITTEERLKALVRRSLVTAGVSEADAATVAGTLVASDLRGIESHGVARLDRYYVSRIRQGTIAARPATTVVRETATSILVDADNGLGHPAGDFTMRRVIEKAREHGIAFGAVRNSNHFGIAGYYAMLALEHDLIGMASTNSSALGVPTFGKQVLIGTNPLAYAIPTQNEPPFVFDFATTTVPLGKLEVYERKGLALPHGWAVDQDGNPTTDPATGMNGALLPLGGFGTEHGGHKGYGLGLLVDILCGVLSGGMFGLDLPTREIGTRPGAVCHWFGAMRIDGMRDLAEFKRDMDRELRDFKNSATAPGCERIYVAGEIEHEKTIRHRRDGIPLHVKVWENLHAMCAQLNIPFELAG